MAVAFPSSINNKFQQGSFTEKPVTDIIRSQMGVANVKTRRRTTRVRYNLVGSIDFSAAEYATFKTFFTTSLAGGSLPVTFTHPLTGIDTDFILTYSANDSGAHGAMVQVNLEEV